MSKGSAFRDILTSATYRAHDGRARAGDHIFNSIRIPFNLEFFFFFQSQPIERALNLLAEAKCRALLGWNGQTDRMAGMAPHEAQYYAATPMWSK